MRTQQTLEKLETPTPVYLDPQKPIVKDPVVKGPGSGFTWAVVGILLFLLAAGFFADGSAVTWQTGNVGTVLFGLALLVLGGAIIISGFRGRRAGLPGVLSVIAAVIALTLLSTSGGSRPGVWTSAAGDIGWVSPSSGATSIAFSSGSRFTPTSVAQAEAGFVVRAGDGTLDLTRLDFGAVSPTNPVVVPVSVTAGNISILVPQGIGTSLDTRVTAGNIDRELSGPPAETLLVLMLQVRAGNITITDDPSYLNR